MKFRIKGL